MRRQKLADLVRRTVSTLPTIFAYKYSWEILKKMDFVKSNSRDHNLKVMEKVCKDNRIEKVLLVVICNVHLSMMLQISEKDQRLLLGMCLSYSYKLWSSSICAQKFPVENLDHSGQLFSRVHLHNKSLFYFFNIFTFTYFIFPWTRCAQRKTLDSAFVDHVMKHDQQKWNQECFLVDI